MKIDYVVDNFETSEIERESRNEEKNCQNKPQSNLKTICRHLQNSKSNFL